MSFTRILFLGAGVLLAANAQQPTKGVASRAVLGAPDQRFMQQAAKACHQAIALGKLGSEKAANPKVKEFAQRLVDDHTRIHTDLEALAKEKGVTLPTAYPKDPAVTKLSKMSGAAFDKEFMRQIMMGHQREIAVFEMEAKSGMDADVKNFATKQLVTLRAHLDAAKAIPL